MIGSDGISWIEQKKWLRFWIEQKELVVWIKREEWDIALDVLIDDET